jgi:hypothetical protein
MMDYLVPMAVEMPDIGVAHVETPTAFSEGGFKGAGEGGVAGAPGAILNAVNDALSPFKARVSRVPMTPEVILRARQLRGPSSFLLSMGEGDVKSPGSGDGRPRQPRGRPSGLRRSALPIT